MCCLNKSKSGFTLIELSIVLVIIGLLVGGVLIGRDLMRQSELRNVLREYNEFESLISLFKGKYGTLPGDMPNATEFFGSAASCPGASTDGNFEGLTCNGNGNGIIDFEGVFSSPTLNETFRFWQHLGAAGLIGGRYDGVTVSGSGYFYGVSTTNSPKSALNNAYWTVSYIDGSSRTFNYSYTPFRYLLGARVGTSWNYGGVLTGAETFSLDNKIDDGMPGTGMVLGKVEEECNDAANDTDYAATYNMTDNTFGCFLMLKTRHYQ